MPKQIEITGAGGVSIPFFCDVTELLGKHFGKNLTIPTERLDLVRQAASVLEVIGQECQAEMNRYRQSVPGEVK